MTCNQCPRHCSVDRAEKSTGFCASPDTPLVSRVALHPWEEPLISGQHGSGTIFFSGCNLRCVFCQNREISRGGVGAPMTDGELTSAMLQLQEKGAHNINLVTPSHYTLRLARILEAVKPRLSIPVVWNSSGYESVASLKKLEGLVDVYLPDVKYYSSELSAAYSHAPDYFPVAMRALAEMLRQQPAVCLNPQGDLIRAGVIVRHLILPSHRHDSMELLQALSREFGTSAYLLSLMCQYTPDFALDTPYTNLHRRLTSFEYQSVQSLAASLGFSGFSQDPASASARFTPRFTNPS